MKTADYQRIAETIPHQPGVYRFLGPEGEVIYVGKAKSLKKRIASYFGDKKSQSYKTGVMVRSAVNLEYTLVDSENDALLLENMLIKKIQPRYNVTWRDDKSYSYICVKKERFPRVFFTRQVIKDGSTYFGPYASKARAKVILEVVRKLFPLRTCALELSEKNIEKGKFKVCLEFHIKNCMGPCEGLESEEDYLEKIRQVKNILKGNFKDVRQHLNERMAKHASEMEFEKAQDIKNKLTFFDDYQGKSTVVSQTIGDVDVFHISEDQKKAYVHYLKVVSGSIIYSHTLEMIKNLNEDKAQMLILAIEHLRETFDSHSPEIIVPFEILSESEFGLSGGLSSSEVTFTVPQRGEKKALLDLAEKNVKHYLFKKQQQEMNQGGRVNSVERILKTLQNDLNMTEVPWHIECFDNSNLHGTNPVASCVVFKNAKPSKSDYRKFNIKTVEGPNDFASMEEIVYRRYHRMIEEGQTLPQLIIIDGGKGQLSAAVKSLETLGISDKVTVIGIAKRLEEIYFPGDSIPLYINKKSESLKLIQQARNEAHRFAITFHRQKRGKEVTQTALTTIAGVGEKTAQKLLIHFGSVARLEQATQEDIEKVIGKSKAKVLMEHFGGPILDTEPVEVSDVGESDKSTNLAEQEQPLGGVEHVDDSQSETPSENDKIG